MRIYRIVLIDIDESYHTVRIKTFLDRENALRYYKKQLKELKEQQEELDMEGYCIDEGETSYEMYLDGRATEQSVSLWLEEDNTYDELVLENQTKMKNEMDKDYEM